MGLEDQMRVASRGRGEKETELEEADMKEDGLMIM